MAKFIKKGKIMKGTEPHWYSEEEPEGIYQDGGSKTCRNCGTAGLHWVFSIEYDNWILVNETGKMHKCKVTPYFKKNIE